MHTYINGSLSTEKMKQSRHGFVIDLDLPPMSLVPCLLPPSENKNETALSDEELEFDWPRQPSEIDKAMKKRIKRSLM